MEYSLVTWNMMEGHGQNLKDIINYLPDTDIIVTQENVSWFNALRRPSTVCGSKNSEQLGLYPKDKELVKNICINTEDQLETIKKFYKEDIVLSDMDLYTLRLLAENMGLNNNLKKDDLIQSIIQKQKKYTEDELEQIYSSYKKRGHVVSRNGMVIYTPFMTIANIHLEGGSYCDPLVLRDINPILQYKLLLLERILEKEPDCIIGDFNSVYSSNPVQLESFIQSQFNYFKKIKKSPLTQEELENIRLWNSAPFDLLKKNGYEYAIPINEATEITNYKGNTIVDTIWYKPNKVKVVECRIIPTPFKSDYEFVSDHNPIYVRFVKPKIKVKVVKLKYCIKNILKLKEQSVSEMKRIIEEALKEQPKGESISLLITGHGKDLDEFSKDDKEKFKHIKVAYRISHDTINFIYKKYFDLLSLYYIKMKEVLYSDNKIMDEYIQRCIDTKRTDLLERNYKLFYDKHKIDPSRYASPVASMVKNQKECYIGHIIVNRSFWFGDKTWKKTEKSPDPDFTDITPPFMGNMFVLRAIQKDGKILQGELLSPMKEDGLDHLRETVQEIILSNRMRIDFKTILPILQELYENIYIYDFACRGAGVFKTERKVRQDIYNQEKQPFDL